MAMKQTQTKLFDFADVGLDFCVGSKSLFPDRFKKMLAIGYNTQTVASVAVAGNQVTLTYGVSHGYVADRVLKVESGVLAEINGGEFWIDSVTSNTVTLTIDDAPVSIAGAFTTKIASLGWELVFEQPYIHVYKFKHLDETDTYLRLCFQDNVANRNRISPCVGKSFDPSTGFITDINSIESTRSCMSPANLAWEFGFWSGSTHNSYTYTQGLSTYGRGIMIGSLYHAVFKYSVSNNDSAGHVTSVLPLTSNLDIAKSKHAVLLELQSPTGNGVNYQAQNAELYVGTLSCNLSKNNSTTLYDVSTITNTANYYANTTESFNTTAAIPIFIYERSTGQLVGVLQGLYQAQYNYYQPPVSKLPLSTPMRTSDINSENSVYLHHFADGNSRAMFIATPVEEIKIA